MGISVIERAKIQAQVLVPLVKALQAELGEERANGLVRKTLGNEQNSRNKLENDWSQYNAAQRNACDALLPPAAHQVMWNC